MRLARISAARIQIASVREHHESWYTRNETIVQGAGERLACSDCCRLEHRRSARAGRRDDGGGVPRPHFGADCAVEVHLSAQRPTEPLTRLVWDTLDVMDSDYEVAALFTEDEGASVIYDAIEVTVDNVDPAETPDIVENRDSKTQALRADVAHEVITADGVVVTLPAGALDGDDRITIERLGRADPQTAPGERRAPSSASSTSSWPANRKPSAKQLPSASRTLRGDQMESWITRPSQKPACRCGSSTHKRTLGC